MPILLQAALGSIIRALLMMLVGFLVKNHIWTESAATDYVFAATTFILGITWSVWQKYKSRLKFLTGLAMPAGATEEQTNMWMKQKLIPSISTPPDAVPVPKPTDQTKI